MKRRGVPTAFSLLWPLAHPQAPQAVLRSKLGLAVRRKTVLLVGGGDGVGGLETVTVKTYEKLAELLPAEGSATAVPPGGEGGGTIGEGVAFSLPQHVKRTKALNCLNIC